MAPPRVIVPLQSPQTWTRPVPTEPVRLPTPPNPLPQNIAIDNQTAGAVVAGGYVDLRSYLAQSDDIVARLNAARSAAPGAVPNFTDHPAAVPGAFAEQLPTNLGEGTYTSVNVPITTRPGAVGNPNVAGTDEDFIYRAAHERYTPGPTEAHTRQSYYTQVQAIADEHATQLIAQELAPLQQEIDTIATRRQAIARQMAEEVTLSNRAPDDALTQQLTVLTNMENQFRNTLEKRKEQLVQTDPRFARMRGIKAEAELQVGQAQVEIQTWAQAQRAVQRAEATGSAVAAQSPEAKAHQVYLSTLARMQAERDAGRDPATLIALRNEAETDQAIVKAQRLFLLRMQQFPTQLQADLQRLGATTFTQLALDTATASATDRLEAQRAATTTLARLQAQAAGIDSQVAVQSALDQVKLAYNVELRKQLDAQELVQLDNRFQQQVQQWPIELQQHLQRVYESARALQQAQADNAPAELARQAAQRHQANQQELEKQITLLSERDRSWANRLVQSNLMELVQDMGRSQLGIRPESLEQRAARLPAEQRGAIMQMDQNMRTLSPGLRNYYERFTGMPLAVAKTLGMIDEEAVALAAEYGNSAIPRVPTLIKDFGNLSPAQQDYLFKYYLSDPNLSLAAQEALVAFHTNLQIVNSPAEQLRILSSDPEYTRLMQELSAMSATEQKGPTGQAKQAELAAITQKYQVAGADVITTKAANRTISGLIAKQPNLYRQTIQTVIQEVGKQLPQEIQTALESAILATPVDRWSPIQIAQDVQKAHQAWVRANAYSIYAPVLLGSIAPSPSMPIESPTSPTNTQQLQATVQRVLAEVYRLADMQSNGTLSVLGYDSAPDIALATTTLKANELFPWVQLHTPAN